MNIFLDIETIPSQNPAHWEWIEKTLRPPAQMSKPETIAKWEAEGRAVDLQKKIQETSLDGAFGEVFCIGFAVDDDEPAVMMRQDLSSEAEEALLDRFLGRFLGEVGAASREIPTFIGHYLRVFDLPFLQHRAIVRRCPALRLPWNDRKGLYTEDTREMWTGNQRDHIGLDKLCCALGIDCLKGDLDGSKVWEYVQAGRTEEVCEYCEDDVRRTREIWKRLR